MNSPRDRKAQSLLELALFGAILVMLLGGILNYGLRYNQQQKIMMNTFRKTLDASSVPSTGGIAAYAMYSDKHVPNPADTYGVGTVMPFSANSSVVRSHQLHHSADTPEELPTVNVEVQGVLRTFRTAGFRYVPNGSGLSRYQEIYGTLNAWDSGGTYVIIDSCEGEIMDYNACKRQCRMMRNNEESRAFCRRECERGTAPGENKNCTEICNADIELPWYCDNLDNIFQFAMAANKPKAMGMQSDNIQRMIVNNAFRKQEAGGVINTTDTINWSTTAERKIVYIDSARVVREVPVTTTVSENQVLNNLNP